MVDLVQREVRTLLQSALSMALLVIRSNPAVLEGLGAQLEGMQVPFYTGGLAVLFACCDWIWYTHAMLSWFS